VVITAPMAANWRCVRPAPSGAHLFGGGKFGSNGMPLMYTDRMETHDDQRQFDALIRKALNTPPISNEEIERRSKA
jgi:hypothetical protein